MNCRFISIGDFSDKQRLKDFDCSVEQLNVYLSRFARKNDSLGIGRTFLALEDDGSIAGYFTLATAQVRFEEIPENLVSKLPKYPIPALRIARLAVRRDLQGKGMGKMLLKEAFRRIVLVSENTGLKFIIVDAKEPSKSFYEKYGFIRSKDNGLCFFLPIETVRMAMLSNV